MTSSIGLLLALGAACSWAGMDVLRKALSAHVRPVPLVAMLSLGQLPLFAAWAWSSGGVHAEAGYWLPGLACAVINLVALTLFVNALRVSPISVTVPLLSLVPVFASAVAALLLNEVPTPRQGVGIGVVVTGALLLQAGALLAPGARREPGVPMMVGVALLWSLTAGLDKLALSHANVPTHALVQAGGVVLGLGGLLAAQGRLGELRLSRRAWVLYAAAVVVSFVAIGLQLVAFTLVLVSMVEAIKRGVGPVAAAVFGRLAFQERLRPV